MSMRSKFKASFAFLFFLACAGIGVASIVNAETFWNQTFVGSLSSTVKLLVSVLFAIALLVGALSIGYSLVFGQSTTIRNKEKK